MSTLLLAAPNVNRLDINFDTLLPLLDTEQNCLLFQQRIIAMCINKSSTSTVSIAEHHLSRITSTFIALRYLYVDLTESGPTMDSMILSILTEFSKQHIQLVELCTDGTPSEEMKTDARKWFLDKYSPETQQFAIYFEEQLSSLFIWM